MATVLLIDPPLGSPDRTRSHIRPQLGTLYLSAMLMRHDINVVLIDWTVDREAGSRLEQILAVPDVICVGISSVIGPMITGGLTVAQRVRSLRPDVPIVWGGAHPTTAPDVTLCHDLVDAICIGEGELTFPEMVEAYRTGRSLAHIKGVGYKQDGHLIYTEPRTEYFDLNTLPALPYHLLDLAHYAKHDWRKPGAFFMIPERQIMSLETSRSCPYRCGYCLNAVKKEKCRFMSPETVLRFMADIVAQGVRGIAICDDNFFANPGRVRRILQGVIERQWNLKIYAPARSDFLARADEEMFELMQAAGVVMLGIGVESGSDAVLNAIKKQETIEETFEANRRLARAGIGAWFNFIAGFPGERGIDCVQTHYAMTKILKENPRYAQINFNQLIPMPSTPVLDACVRYGWRAPATLEEWATVIETTRTTPPPPYIDQEVYAWMKNNFIGLQYPISDVTAIDFISSRRLYEEQTTAARIKLRYEGIAQLIKYELAHVPMAEGLPPDARQHLVIYGWGLLGKKVAALLQNEGIGIDYIIDSNVALHKTVYNGIPIIPLTALKDIPGLTAVLVTVVDDFECITNAIHAVQPAMPVIAVNDFLAILQKYLPAAQPTLRRRTVAGDDVLAERYQQLITRIPDIFHYKSLFYIGARDSRFLFGKEFYEQGYAITVAEAYAKNVEYLKTLTMLKDVVHLDITTLAHHPLSQCMFDIVMWIHGPEHISGDQLIQLIPLLERMARHHVVLMCPWGAFPQGALEGNPYEVHRQAYYPEFFDALGFLTDVVGEKDVCGSNLMAWKTLHERVAPPAGRSPQKVR